MVPTPCAPFWHHSNILEPSKLSQSGSWPCCPWWWRRWPFPTTEAAVLIPCILLLLLFFSPLLHISSFRFATTTVDLLTLFSFTVLAQPTRWICKQTTLLRLHILTLEKCSGRPRGLPHPMSTRPRGESEGPSGQFRQMGSTRQGRGTYRPFIYLTSTPHIAPATSSHLNAVLGSSSLEDEAKTSSMYVE